jgi:hypothetical protein
MFWTLHNAIVGENQWFQGGSTVARIVLYTTNTLDMVKDKVRGLTKNKILYEFARVRYKFNSATRFGFCPV